MAPTRAGPMEYRLTGRGPVVLVLKGGHRSRDTRLGHERLTAYGFAVLEPSRPGYDGSPASLGRSAPDAANALPALLDTRAIERADVVAFRSLWSGEGFICDLDQKSEGRRQLTRPVLILDGRHDRETPPHHVERLVALCQTNRRIELDADTHFIWFGRTRVEVWEKRLAFLRS